MATVKDPGGGPKEECGLSVARGAEGLTTLVLESQSPSMAVLLVVEVVEGSFEEEVLGGMAPGALR
jgi:hypothetical protein